LNLKFLSETLPRFSLLRKKREKESLSKSLTNFHVVLQCILFVIASYATNKLKGVPINAKICLTILATSNEVSVQQNIAPHKN
jgi:ABC-type xylose transport system permease subunit